MDPTVETAPLLITPPADASSFTVGGVIYTATDGLSVDRMRVFQRLSLEFGADTRLSAFMQGIDAVWEKLNGLQAADAIQQLGQMRDGLNIIGSNRLRDVELCALFFNRNDEDPGAYNFAQQTQKAYTEWASVAAGFFFVSAFRLLNASHGSLYLLPEATPPTPTSAPSLPE